MPAPREDPPPFEAYVRTLIDVLHHARAEYDRRSHLRRSHAVMLPRDVAFGYKGAKYGLIGLEILDRDRVS